MSYWNAVYTALMESDPSTKHQLIKQLFDADVVPNDDSAEAPQRILAPGLPAAVELIDPRLVPRRRLGTPKGRAAMCHAVAHIEFNAMNLALDACYRFREMPEQYYRDWLSVAWDESRHFQLLAERMAQLDCHYGDFPAHTGLWDTALKTDHDVLTRMALVPRVLEARGLDVTPSLIKRLNGIGDPDTAAVLEVILREEVRHVEIGSFWYKTLCEQSGREPEQTFRDLLAEYAVLVKPPLNHSARCEAGFSEAEIQQLMKTFNHPS